MPLRRQCAFDIGEAALEFGVRATQRGFGVSADMPCQIDQREQEIAGFGGEFPGVAAVERVLYLVGFLANLVQHRAGVVPIEADGGGLALQRHRARQGRLARLDACQQRLGSSRLGRPARGALGFLLRLDAVPYLLDMRGRQSPLAVGKDMRMPPDHLAGDRLNHIAKCKRILLFRHAGVVNDLEQEIAEFFAEIVEIATRDGVDDLIGLLDGVGCDRRKILFEVPRTTGDGRPQHRHDFEQA